jgi:Clp amino terminal domain, pathogenicity island component
MGTLEELVASVDATSPNGDLSHKLAQAASTSLRLDQLGQRLVRHFVREARGAGMPWAEIGQSLGVSRQAAQQRFGGPSVESPTASVQPPPEWTDEAKRVINEGGGRALRLGHRHLGTEHLLAGLLAEPDTLGARAIAGLTGSLDSAWTTLESALGAPRPADNDQIGRPSGRGLPFTARAGVVMTDLAPAEAQRLGDQSIRSEHVLLALLSDAGGSADAILRDLGVTKESAENLITQESRKR